MSYRELKVLEAVIQMYIETAEPAGSNAVARRSGLGVSAATVRATMGELERKGFLFHPHTSAGRIPTDLAYRAYVDRLIDFPEPSPHDRMTLETEVGPDSELELILLRAAQVLGVLTQELGVAVAPALETVKLERLDLVRVSTEQLLLVLNLKSGVVRTIFVQIPGTVAPEAVEDVARILNERLAGQTLAELRHTLGDRLRDAGTSTEGRSLLNIFLAESENILEQAMGTEGVHLGSAQMLAEQPEFSSNERMRGLLDLTERRDLLREALRERRASGLSITIGGENLDSRLSDLTLVTASYSQGDLRGVIGVLGPTRMPYNKIIGLVQHTSRLIEGLMD